MSSFRLPNLRNVVLECPSADCFHVLQAHGCQLREVTAPEVAFEGHSVFDMCPGLSILTLDLDMDMAILEMPQEKRSLDANGLNYPGQYNSLLKLCINIPDPCVAFEHLSYFLIINTLVSHPE